MQTKSLRHSGSFTPGASAARTTTGVLMMSGPTAGCDRASRSPSRPGRPCAIKEFLRNFFAGVETSGVAYCFNGLNRRPRLPAHRQRTWGLLGPERRVICRVLLRGRQL